jgi:hypothetical protein
MSCANPPALEEGSGGEGGGGGAAGKDGGGNGGRAGTIVNTGGGGGTSTTGAGGASPADAGAEAGPTRSVACTSTMDVAIGSFSRVVSAFTPGVAAIYAAPVMSPQLGAMDKADELSLEFVQLNADSFPLNGGATGVFNLVADSVPLTCARCVRIRVDGGQYEFLAQSGILVVNQSSPVDGTLDATLTDVTLSMISGQALTGVNCLHIASLAVQVKM